VRAVSRFENLGQALRLLRRRDGRSQVELAEAAGVSAAMLSNYEKGTKMPTVGSLGKIIDALGVELRRLDEALDLVNDRPSRGDGAAPDWRPPAPEAAPGGLTFLPHGGDLASDLEVGLFEISRGFERMQRRVMRRSSG
jgi:transcriptional regulator with XRE-family HTH domain